MAEQPGWKALLANKKINEFVDELLTVMSGWAVDADFKEPDAQIEVPYTFKTGQYIRADIFDVLRVLNKHALYRARRHLLENEPKTSHLQSLPGNVLMKIFNFLREDPAKMPLLFTIKKPILADASAPLRRTYFNELFNQPLLMEIYPEESFVGEEKHSKTFANAAYVNKFLNMGLSQRHDEGLNGVLQLHIKVTPVRAADFEESLESPVTVAISFSAEQGKLTRPTLTLSYDSSRPWRHTTAMSRFWRVAINSMWDGGELHRGLGMKVIGRLFYAAGWFVREQWWKGFDARNPLLRPLFRPPPATNDDEDDTSEDLFEDESDDEDDDTETDVDEEVGQMEGGIIVKVLESTWFTGELSPATWRELRAPSMLDGNSFDYGSIQPGSVDV